MSTIDERVVRMNFDNAQFEQGIKTTQASLANLNKTLQMKDASKGLAGVQTAVNGMNLSKIASGVDSIASKFSAMGAIAVTAISNITNKVVNAGLNLAKSLTVAPITQGLHEYETTLNSIQTIMANTGLEGQKGMGQVNAALQDLNAYSDKTIYNFSEMARNIGTFTAAGVKLGPATQAIKGIANLAAVSGSSADQASTAMYQLSQAMASGTVKLQDWNSVVNAGMGGKVFQNALKETAKAHGVAVDQMIKKSGSFRESLKGGWLTSQVLTETLSKFTGDLTAAQLKTMGYNDKQIAGILKMGKTAQDAATKVKTMSQLIGTLQEAVGSGWAQTWQIVFGTFDEAKTLFTNVSNVLGGFIQSSANARNKVLADWKTLGGRTMLIQAISNVFNDLIAVLKPVKEAFREIFPPMTGAKLQGLTLAFLNFTKKLKPAKDTLDNIKRTFAGIFAVFDIGWMIVKELAGVFIDLFSSATKGSGGILDFTAKVGDWLVKVRDALKNGDGLHKFFEGLGKVLAFPIKAIKAIIGFIGNLISSMGDLGKGPAGAAVDRMKERFSGLGKIGDFLANVWVRVVAAFKAAGKVVGPVIEKIKSALGGVISAIGDGLKNTNWSTVLDAINTGLFAGLVLLIRKFLNNGLKIGVNVDAGQKGIFDKIKGIFSELTGTLKAMQMNLKANVLLKIAGAIAILTVSVVALSLIDSGKLTKALTAITVMFTQLGGALYAFDKITTTKQAAKMAAIGLGLILLATAIDILAVAVKVLSTMKWNELAKGLTGVIVLIGGLVLATKGLTKQKGMVKSAAGLILLAVAIKILVGAVKDLAKLSWGDLAKGLVGVGALLLGLGLFQKFAATNKGGFGAGAGLILMAVGLKILVGVVKDFAQMSWKDIGKGLAAVGGGLALMAAALGLLPPSSVMSAVAILIAAQALTTIGDAMKSMSKMSWKEIGKGMVVMAGALTLLTAALVIMGPESIIAAPALLIAANALVTIGDAMKSMGQMNWSEIGKSLTLLGGALLLISAAMLAMLPALPGAAALVVVAAALQILQPVLKSFGDMSWGEIGKGLVMLGGALLIVAIGGVALLPAIPGLMGLGAAILLIGAGALAAGMGLTLIAAGMAAIALAGAGGILAIKLLLQVVIDMIPQLAQKLGEGFVTFVEVIANNQVRLMAAWEKVLTAMLDTIVRMAPKIGRTFMVVATVGIAVLNSLIPKLVTTGFNLLMGILHGIEQHIGAIVATVGRIIVKFLNALAAQMKPIADAGARLLVAFLNGIADAITNHSDEINAAGGRIASALIQGTVNGIVNGASSVGTAAVNMAKGAFTSAMNYLEAKSPSKLFQRVGGYVVAGFVKGLKGNSAQITDAFNSMKAQLKNLIGTTAAQADKAEARLKKLRAARKQDTAAIKEQTAALAQANKEHAKASKAYTVLTKYLTDERNHLKTLANTYAKNAAQLDIYRQQLADAKKTRDDYNASVKDQFDTLPDVTQETKLTDYITELQQKISDTHTFTTAIQKLRTLGLNDEAYKMLIAKGVDALPFIQQLLDGGKASVDQINNLGSQLASEAGSLANNASTSLYQAGVNAAQGLVDGLASQQKNIEKQMSQIAGYMVAAIKRALGIKSPSKVFHELGVYSGEGMSSGLDDSMSTVAASAENLGKEAILGLQKSLTGISDLVVGEIDLNPTITPTLDLTSVQKDAQAINALMKAQPVAVGSAYSLAREASAGYQANKMYALQQQTAVAESASPIQFNQYNTSPKALSQAEIYRQTKNQLSVAKGALTT